MSSILTNIFSTFDRKVCGGGHSLSNVVTLSRCHMGVTDVTDVTDVTKVTKVTDVTKVTNVTDVTSDR